MRAMGEVDGRVGSGKNRCVDRTRGLYPVPRARVVGGSGLRRGPKCRAAGGWGQCRVGVRTASTFGSSLVRYL